MHTELPILYSFRRCPYAMRARLAIYYSGINIELREVILRDKPISMLDYSAKGEVPVLILNDGTVLKESLDIIYWALANNDPEQWLPTDTLAQQQVHALIDENDNSFKRNLDRYKYPERYPDEQDRDYRSEGENFLQRLEKHLEKHDYLLSEKISIVDIAIMPFIRQFAHADKDWFDQTPYPHLQKWLTDFLEAELFSSVMKKYPAWKPNDTPVCFP